MKTFNKREASPESAPFSPTSKLKWVKTTLNVREKPCIFCNKFKCQGDSKWYHISEVNVAKTLLKTVNFNKDSVHTRCILFKNAGDAFAADVMYHSNCLNKNFKKFCHDVNSFMAFEIEDDKDRWSGISWSGEELGVNFSISFWKVNPHWYSVWFVQRKSIKSNERDRWSDGNGIH